MRLPALLVLLLGGLSLAAALFEDQAGTFDWYKPHIGLISAAAFHPTKPRVCAATQQSVLGCLNLRDGTIAWRKVLEDGKDAAFLQLEELHLIVVATHSSVQAFDLEGFLKWEKRLGPCGHSGPHGSPKLLKLAGDPGVSKVQGVQAVMVAVQHGTSITVGGAARRFACH